MRKSGAENKERADTERQTDMKQIRRISEVAEELGETALIGFRKCPSDQTKSKDDFCKANKYIPNLSGSPHFFRIIPQ